MEKSISNSWMNFYNENSKVKFKEVASCVVYVIVLIGVSLCLK